MSLDNFIVIFLGGFLIGFIFWFFLMKKEREIAVSDAVTVTVNGGYSPEVIVIPQGKTTQITFIRHDANSCLEEVVLGDFKIRKHLPLNQPVIVSITPQKTGEFGYSCGMNMFHGKIIVR